MKTLRIAIGCLLLTAAVTFGQTTQSITFSDNGLYGGTNTTGTFASTSNFSLTTNVTFTGFTGRGLSYWLEVPSALAPFITITSRNPGVWSDPNAGAGTVTFGSATGTDSGFTGENADLGYTSAQDPNTLAFTEDKAPGTYSAGTLGFTLTGAPNGTYTLQLETLSPHASEISDNNNAAHAVAVSTYTITVVPEPATWSLMGLGGLGAFGLTWLRARRKS